MNGRFEVLTDTAEGWVNTFMCDDELETYGTYTEAAAEIADHVETCRQAVADGYMTSAPSYDEFKIVEVTE